MRAAPQIRQPFGRPHLVHRCCPPPHPPPAPPQRSTAPRPPDGPTYPIPPNTRRCVRSVYALRHACRPADHWPPAAVPGGRSLGGRPQPPSPLPSTLTPPPPNPRPPLAVTAKTHSATPVGGVVCLGHDRGDRQVAAAGSYPSRAGATPVRAPPAAGLPGGAAVVAVVARGGGWGDRPRGGAPRPPPCPPFGSPPPHPRPAGSPQRQRQPMPPWAPFTGSRHRRRP